MEKGLWDGAYMRILLNGKWHVVLEDGTTGQMDLPGTLDENGIGHRDVGANQWHPDAVLGNAAGEIDKDAPIATRFTRRHTYEGEARISRKITVPDYGTDRLFVLAERARALRLLVDGEVCAVFRQGTALVGMMNSHLEPKPYDFARPERFREFFTESRIFVKMPRYTYEEGEYLTAEVEVANFGKESISGELVWTLGYRDCAVNTGSGEFLCGRADGQKNCPPGTYTSLGRLDIPLEVKGVSAAFMLTVSMGDCTSTYPVWVYKKTSPECPKNVYETRVFDEQTRAVLQNGGRVYLSPDADKESLPYSIKTQFTTDFWSVGTFADQEGGMGQLIDTEHPIFKEFPTDFHTDWQWWIMASKRAVILPHPMKTIITEMDSYAFLRPMAQMIEFRCLKGKVLLSTMELHKSQQYPEVRALQASIYTYLSGENFEPAEEITEEELSMLVRG